MVGTAHGHSIWFGGQDVNETPAKRAALGDEPAAERNRDWPSFDAGEAASRAHGERELVRRIVEDPVCGVVGAFGGVQNITGELRDRIHRTLTTVQAHVQPVDRPEARDC